MDLSATHIHLLINHIPTVGFVIGLGLFVVGLVAKSDHLKVTSLVMLVGVALITIPVYATGSAAQERICGSTAAPGPCEDAALSRTLIEMHEGAAFASLILMVFVGGLAWLGLWHYRRLSRIPAWNIALLLLVGLVTLGEVSYAASLGGEISHPEIRVTQDATEPPLGRAIGTFVANTPWAWAAFEALHMVGLSLLIGIVLLFDLKLLGFAPSLQYATLDRLLPWAVLAFGFNVITGMSFFAASPWQYVGNVAFNWKMIFVMVAGVNAMLLTFDLGRRQEGEPAPAYSKALAASALALWVGVMFWGSMLPFIGQAF